jgi:dTDP-4-amino-4,6-dideoxygalactose transaminase
LRTHSVTGGEVITTPFSFAASVQAIEWAGATPVYVDIDADTMTIDPSAVEAAITPQTRAILAVHIYGMPCDVRALERVAKRHGVALIFDAAHAFDTRIEGVPIHRFGDATVYSTHASKLFHTGEGGLLVCNDAGKQLAAERMSNFGFDGSGDAVCSGTNAKMSELHAAMGLSILPEIEAERSARAALRLQYANALGALPGIRLVSIPLGVRDSLQYAALRVVDASKIGQARQQTALGKASIALSQRDAIHDCLIRHGIGTRKYFYPLCNSFSYQTRSGGASISRSQRALTHARSAADTVLCLPFHSGVREHAVHAIATLIKRTLNSR